MLLIHLPSDVIHDICLIFCLGDPSASPRVTFHDLSSLSKVSRRLHGIATPILYRHSLCDAPRESSLILLLRTLIQNPELASHVKEARLNTEPTNSDLWMPLLNEIIESLDIRLPDGWDEGEAPSHSQSEADEDSEDGDEDGYEDGYEEAYREAHKQWAIQDNRNRLRQTFVINLLLSLIKNLQHLSVHLTEDFKYGTHILPSTTDLSPLHSLQLLGPASVPGFGLRAYENLCNKALNLKELRVDNCLSTTADLSLKNLTSLTFSSSIIHKNGLSRLLKTCEALQSFTFSLRDANSRLRFTSFRGLLATPGVMVQELSRFRSTLKHLAIWADHPILWNHSTQPDAFITSLEQFSTLATLSLSEWCLFKEGVIEDGESSLPRNFLPASIEAVVLDNISPASGNIAEEIERQARSLHMLKTFQVNMRSPGTKRNPPTVAQ